jgi:hypothetical protein
MASDGSADVRAKVYEDHENPGVWRVEKLNADAGYDDLQVFIGPDAREKAIRYATRAYGQFDLIEPPD